MKKIPAFLLTPLFLFWFISIVAVSIYLCGLPMTHALGFEYAFIMGALISLASGHIATTRAHQQRHTPDVSLSIIPRLCPSRTATPVAYLLVSAAQPGFIFLAVALTVTLANQLIVPPCNNGQGLAFFVLLPVCSTICAVIIGAFIGAAVSKKRRAIATWYCIWFGSLFIALLEAYFTPAVYAFGIFFGYWPGVWYDKEISVINAFLSYRLYNGLTVASLVLMLRLFLSPATWRFESCRLSIRHTILLTGCLLSLMAFVAFGDALHHRTSTSSLKRALPHHASVDGIQLYFDAKVSKKRRFNLTRDAAFSVYQLRRFFDLKEIPEITIFVFRDAVQKHRLMGARHTSVAKPWLGQAYIVADETPHWTLRHELAHLIGAAFGEGPFGVGGKYGGLVPYPALIEGIAVAATPTHRALDLHQNAKALKDLELLPRLSRLMGIGFLSLYAHSAYTVSGSFCLFVHDTFGASALKRLYAGESTESATGLGLTALESRWLAFLDTVHVPKAEMAKIKYTFDRPAIIAGKCVREVARLQREAETLKNNTFTHEALQTMQKAHVLSGYSTETELNLFFMQTTCAQRDAKEHGQYLLQSDTDKIRSLHISEALQDMQIDTLPLTTLAASYRKLQKSTTDADDTRRLFVKAYIAATMHKDAKTVLAFLSTVPVTSRPSPTVAIYTLERMLKKRPDDPVLLYLCSRILFLDQSNHGAAVEMKKAIQHGLAQVAPPLELEARFTLGRAYLNLRQYQKASEQFQQITKNTAYQKGFTQLAKDWLSRTTWQQSQQNPSRGKKESL
ncbi:MAG: hypothetical protein JXR76_25180 [Deltaproteobacteria bacterium]|nr:hypothetical protein [Deltaproteobacteria bacterium]